MRCFVYGTLKKGQCRASIMSNANFVGNDQTVDGEFVLLDCGYYPAIVKANEFDAPSMVVHGEVYEIDKSLLKTLDAVEGYPSLYTREEINLASGEKAIAYIYARPKTLAKLPIIEDGNWQDNKRNR